jgi:conjugal transfer pilus assembly protein TraI
MATQSPPGSAFPAADPGFAALPVEELLASVDELVARIRLCFGVDRDTFDLDVQPLLRNYAAYVHLLPATADNYFSAPGGLLRLGLEVAFFSLQGTDAHIFSGRSTISVRRHLEPRWRQATFIGGLCSELHRVLSHIIVADAGGDVWPAYLLPLDTWLVARRADRYFVRWRPNAAQTRGLGVLALPHVVPASTLQFLNEDNAVIVPHLLGSIGGMPVYRDHNVLDSLVRRSLALVIDRNLQANADRYGAPQFGSHLERYLVDALRRLAASHSAWAPNHEKSRVWFGRDGLFLLWPQSAADMQALLEADQLPGIPKAPETVLELLLAAGVLEAQDGDRATWTIRPPEAKSALEAVKLASPAILFAGVDALPLPLELRLVCKPGEVSPTRSAAKPAPAAPPGTQFSLIDSLPPSDARESPDEVPSPARPEATPAVPAPPPPDPAPAAAPPLPTFSLKAPLRLNPAVRDALESVVETLNGPGASAAACAVANGLFVPLHELEGRGIQPAVAMRALSDGRMLVHQDRNRPPTVSQRFGADITVGLVIDPRCVEGFDLAAFNVADQAGG